MTQEEIDAYWLVFRRVVSNNYDIMNGINNIYRCFYKYSTYTNSDIAAINSFCDISSTPYININNIDVSVIEHLRKTHNIQNAKPQKSEELKYVVCFDDKDLAIINTVSNKVGGYPDRTLRKHISGRMTCSQILFTIFGYRKYLDTGDAKGQYIFSR